MAAWEPTADQGGGRSAGAPGGAPPTTPETKVTDRDQAEFYSEPGSKWKEEAWWKGFVLKQALGC